MSRGGSGPAASPERPEHEGKSDDDEDDGPHDPALEARQEPLHEQVPDVAEVVADPVPATGSSGIRTAAMIYSRMPVPAARTSSTQTSRTIDESMLR